MDLQNRLYHPCYTEGEWDRGRLGLYQWQRLWRRRPWLSGPEFRPEFHTAGDCRPEMLLWALHSGHQFWVCWESADSSLPWLPLSPFQSWYLWLLFDLESSSRSPIFWGRGLKRLWVFSGRLDNAQALVFRLGFCSPYRVRRDSISVLQRCEQEPIYNQENKAQSKPSKSHQSGYWIFCFRVCFSINILKYWVVLEADPTVLIFSLFLGL